MLTHTLFPIINGYSRLIIIAYAFGASLLSIGPVSDVLGDQAIFQQIAASLLLTACISAPWLIISGQGKQRLFTSMIACLIAILPPFGTLASPNPFIAAGYLFPNTGFMGLLLVAAIIIVPVHLKVKNRTIFATLIILTAGLTNLFYKAPAAPQNWTALNTEFQDFYDNPLLERNKRMSLIRDKITEKLEHGNKVIIIPETVLGLDSPGLSPQLKLLEERAKRNDATLLLGLVTSNKNQRENSLIILGHDTPKYDARQPVPLVMWNLWPTGGFKAHWFRSGVRDIAGKRTALLICWEEWVVWPMLLSSFYDPQVILSASNHGWTRKQSNMWKYQTINAKAQARLYGLPIIRAVNKIQH